MAEQERKRIGLWPRMMGALVAAASGIQGISAVAHGSPWLAAGLIGTAPFAYRMVRTLMVSDADYRSPPRTVSGLARPLLSNSIGILGAGMGFGYAVSGMAPLPVSLVAGAVVSGAYVLGLSSQYTAHYVAGKEREARAAGLSVPATDRGGPGQIYGAEPAPKADLEGLSRAAAITRLSARANTQSVSVRGDRGLVTTTRPSPDLHRVPENLHAGQPEVNLLEP